MRVGVLLGFLAVVAAATVVGEVAVLGTPRLGTVVAAALLAGTAAAWPVAQRQPVGLPTCGECGYPSWASVEAHFCIRCGSRRVWRFEDARQERSS